MKHNLLVASIALILGAGIIQYAHAADPFIMAGQSTVDLVGTGAWYVDEAPHQLETRSLAWAIGLRGESWRAGYIDFGRIESDAKAYNPDTAYEPKRHRGCPSKGCAPENRYRGIFKTDGLYATYEPRWGIFTAGAGLAYLRYRSAVTVDMAPGDNPYTGAYQEKQNFRMQVNCSNEYSCSPEKQITYLLTAGIESRHWSLTAQSFPNAFGTGGISKGITTVMVGYKF